MKQKTLVATDPELLAIAERITRQDRKRDSSERLLAIEHVRQAKAIYWPLANKYKRD